MWVGVVGINWGWRAGLVVGVAAADVDRGLGGEVVERGGNGGGGGRGVKEEGGVDGEAGEVGEVVQVEGVGRSGWAAGAARGRGRGACCRDGAVVVGSIALLGRRSLGSLLLGLGDGFGAEEWEEREGVAHLGVPPGLAGDERGREGGC